MPRISVGDVVKWSTSRKPLGKVVHIFTYDGENWAVVKTERKGFVVVRIYEELLVVGK